MLAIWQLSGWRASRRTLLVGLVAALLLLGESAPARGGSQLYPDLRTLPPSDLHFAEELIDGATHHVLRFAVTIWNAGQGPLELRGVSSADTATTLVLQRVYDETSEVAELPVGGFVYHEAHNHWHFEQFAEYQLWTRGEFDRWVLSGRTEGEPGWRGSKTTGQGESFCIRDSRRIASLPNSPPTRGYNDCGHDLQGVSVGWGDTYASYLPEQWIDLGEAPLPNGDYALRVIADPAERLYESASKEDPSRDGPLVNEAVVSFNVRGDRVRVRPSP